MTDNKIIKALEYCKNGCEKKCHLFNTDECQNYLFTNILDLIKRQQEEIEELRVITGLMQKRKYYNKFVEEVFQKERGSNLVYPDADEIYKRYFDQQAEIERLEKAIDIHKAIAEDWKYEVKRLGKVVGDVNEL